MTPNPIPEPTPTSENENFTPMEIEAGAIALHRAGWIVVGDDPDTHPSWLEISAESRAKFCAKTIAVVAALAECSPPMPPDPLPEPTRENWTVWALSSIKDCGWYVAGDRMTEEAAKADVERLNARTGPHLVTYVATPPAVYPWD